MKLTTKTIAVVFSLLLVAGSSCSWNNGCLRHPVHTQDGARPLQPVNHRFTRGHTSPSRSACFFYSTCFVDERVKRALPVSPRYFNLVSLARMFPFNSRSIDMSRALLRLLRDELKRRRSFVKDAPSLLRKLSCIAVTRSADEFARAL